VKRLESEWRSGQVVTLDVMDPRIRSYAEEVGFEVTPTFILYDPQGQEVRRWIGQTPDLDQLP